MNPLSLLFVQIACTSKEPSDSETAPPSDSYPISDDTESIPQDTMDTETSPDSMNDTGDSSSPVETADTSDTSKGDDTSDTGDPDLILSTDQYTQVSAAWSYSCGLGLDGSATCWGLFNESHPGPYSMIRSEGIATCGLTLSGEIDCFISTEEIYEEPTTGPFIDLDVGFEYACAIDANGYVYCWGLDDSSKDDYGQVTDAPLTNGFIQITSGYAHACALHTSGTTTCWGSNLIGEGNVPTDTFVQISAGRFFTCGINSFGIVKCWGTSITGTPTTTSFYQISSGQDDFLCGIESSTSLSCLGTDVFGRTLSPYGSYIFTTTGSDHACAVNIDGYITCWGDNSDGQTTPP